MSEGGFGADWLSLREPYDRLARDRKLIERLSRWAHDQQSLRIVDLGSGTGSTVRALAQHLPAHQDWVLVEHDPVLVARGEAMLEGASWHYRRADLADALEDVLQDADLVTGSAFLDLVGEVWLQRLARRIKDNGTALWMALSYDGVWRWRPGDVFDAEIHGLFDHHQRGDKGLGPALGPDAALHLCALLEGAGGTLHRARSDWRLAYEDRAIQQILLDGYATAAREAAPQQAGEIEDWQRQREGFIKAGRSAHTVGHLDLLWLP